MAGRYTSILLILLLSGTVGCSKQGAKERGPAVPETQTALKTAHAHRAALPDTFGLSRAKLQAQIETERKRQESKARKGRVPQAAQILADVRSAVRALQNEKAQTALSRLKAAQSALKSLRATSQRNHLLPVESSVEVLNLASNVDSIKAARDLAVRLVKQGRLQEARVLLDDLVSEIRITTVLLPPQVFAEAVKQAVRQIEKKHPAEAQRLLESALSRLEIVQQAIPLPVVVARALVGTAAGVADSSREAALLMLKGARQQLKLAKLLGYHVNDPRYSRLEKQIDALQMKLKLAQPVEDFFARLKKDLETFYNSFTKG